MIYSVKYHVCANFTQVYSHNMYVSTVFMFQLKSDFLQDYQCYNMEVEPLY